jgi:hypothetical protein
MPDRQGPLITVGDISFPEFFDKLSYTPFEVAHEVFRAALEHHSRATIAWGHCKGYCEVVIAGSEVTFLYVEDDQQCFFVMCMFKDKAKRISAFVFDEGADIPELVLTNKFPCVQGNAAEFEQWMVRKLSEAMRLKHPSRGLLATR